MEKGFRILRDIPPATCFTRIGWVDPVARWGRLIDAELHAYALPFISMKEYSRSRPEWHQRGSSVFTLRSWLFALEEHSFFLFAIKSLATICIKTPSKLITGDRKLLLVMVQVWRW